MLPIKWVTMAALLGVLGLLAGCAKPQATRAYLDAERLAKQYDRAIDRHLDCLATARAAFRATDAGHLYYASRLYNGRQDPRRFEKMAIERTADSAEKRASLKHREVFLNCHAQAMADYAAIDPAYGNIYGRLMMTNESALLDLLRDRITIGDANRRENESLAEAAREWDEATTEIWGQFRTAHQAELDRRVQARQLRELKAISHSLDRLALEADGLE